MEGGFSSCKMWIMLQILTYMIIMVIATNAKIKGTFKCTPPRHTAITCSTTNLPNVTEGSFECPPNTDIPKGESCAVICNDGFYPAYSRHAVCEAGTTNQGGVWSNGSFVCRAITCLTTNLPNVTDGTFGCDPDSIVQKDERCTLICSNGFYPAYHSQAVCEEGVTNQGGVWSDGNFVCQRFDTSATTCLTTNLPNVTDGTFDCYPNSVVPKGKACTLTCNNGLYPAYPSQAECVGGVTNQGGVWSDGNFECRHFECNVWNKWNDSEYKLTSTWKSWSESRQFCERENSHLVTIENKEENEFVRKMVKHCIDRDNKWNDLLVAIGLNDRTTEGTWEWSDGTVSTYRNWREGQPDGKLRAQDCGFIHGNNGKWHDYWCTYKNDVVCETDNTLT